MFGAMSCFRRNRLVLQHRLDASLGVIGELIGRFVFGKKMCMKFKSFHQGEDEIGCFFQVVYLV